MTPQDVSSPEASLVVYFPFQQDLKTAAMYLTLESEVEFLSHLSSFWLLPYENIYEKSFNWLNFG